jgi:hypothetical protein
MALNFGVLDQGGPSNFFEGYSQGQEKMQANAMAQQRAAQAQQEFGMRQQEFAAGQADKQRVANAAMVTQRTLAARDALLRARTPDEARAIVRARHVDPYLGKISQQFGTLEQDLADIPEEATAFQQYKEREAMGAEAFLKQQAGSREFASAMGGAQQAMPQAAPINAMAPVGSAAPAPMANAIAAPAMSGELQNYLGQRERLTALANQTPQIKATIDRLNKEIARLSPNKPEPTVLARLQADFTTATDPKVRKEIQARIDKEVSHPLPTRVETKVNAFVPASEAAQTEFMREARVTYSALKNAQPTLDNIEAAKALVPTAKGFMGAGGEPLLAAASFLNNRLGTKIDTKGVVDATELRSRLFFGILDNLKKLDSQPSQSQQAAMQEALGNLGTDPNALGRVLDAFGDSIRTKVDSHNIEMSDAQTRGVKFPYNPRIVIKPKSGAASNPHAGKTNEQIKKELGL